MYHATGATQQIFHHQQPQRPNKFGYLTQQEQRSKFSTINNRTVQQVWRPDATGAA
jgi:hypothetical protein